MTVSAFCYSKQKCGEFSNHENSSCLWLQDDWNSFREKFLFSCDIYALQTSRKYCFYWTLELLNLCYINRSISHIIIKNGNSQTACEQGQEWFLGSRWDFKQEDGGWGRKESIQTGVNSALKADDQSQHVYYYHSSSCLSDGEAETKSVKIFRQ